MRQTRVLRTLAFLALLGAFFCAGMAIAPRESAPLVAEPAAPAVATAAPAAAAAIVIPATTAPNTYPVIKVIDGDTFDTLIDGTTTRIRIIGLDTPETVDPRKPVQCFGKEASAEAHKLLDGKRVRLEYEPDDSLDKYGRTLAYVFLVDGTSYEKFMIENGYGHEYTYQKTYRYQKEFRTAQAAAKASKRGFWADDTCAGNTTKPAAST